MELKIPIEIVFDDVNSVLDELGKLQKYKLREGGDMTLVNVYDVDDVLTRHVMARKAKKPCGTKEGWIPCSERLPEDNVPVNITWVNRQPEYYYKHIQDVPFTATGVYFQGKWYWYSSSIEDYLAEYGRAEWDKIEESMHKSIEVIAWMPLPKPYGGESDETD